MTKHKSVSSTHHEKVKNHAKALVAATHHIAEEGVSEARNRLSEVMESVSETFEDLEEAAIDRAKQADHYVRARPYQTAAIALGLGAVIGFLFAKRQK